MKRIPNRYSPDKAHRSYGITNFLEKHNIDNRQQQNQIIREFAQLNNYVSKNGINRDDPKFTAFISARFADFSNYALKRIKELPPPEPKIKKKKEPKPFTEPHKLLEELYNTDTIITPIATKKATVRGPGIGIEGIREYLQRKLTNTDQSE